MRANSAGSVIFLSIELAGCSMLVKAYDLENFTKPLQLYALPMQEFIHLDCYQHHVVLMSRISD